MDSYLHKTISVADCLLALQDFQNYTVARDTFLSHLGATLWGSLKHIISPSLADGAFHYHEKISFQLYFITQEVKEMWMIDYSIKLGVCMSTYFFCFLYVQKFRDIRQLPLDQKSLKDGLSSMLLPSQQPLFSTQM